MDRELKEEMLAWVRKQGHRISLPGLGKPEDFPGTPWIRTQGCSCCSVDCLDDLGVDRWGDDGEPNLEWTYEDHVEFLKTALRAILKEYNLKPSDLEEPTGSKQAGWGQ